MSNNTIQRELADNQPTIDGGSSATSQTANDDTLETDHSTGINANKPENSLDDAGANVTKFFWRKFGVQGR